jgi:hypothetical protein
LFDNDSGSLELADFFLGLFGQNIDNDLTPAAG